MLWFFVFLHTVSALRSDWTCMHNAGVNELKEIVSEYSESFPCEECREHIKEYLSEKRVELSEKWVCEFHNDVNKRLNKSMYDC